MTDPRDGSAWSRGSRRGNHNVRWFDLHNFSPIVSVLILVLERLAGFRHDEALAEHSLAHIPSFVPDLLDLSQTLFLLLSIGAELSCGLRCWCVPGLVWWRGFLMCALAQFFLGKKTLQKECCWCCAYVDSGQ